MQVQRIILVPAALLLSFFAFATPTFAQNNIPSNFRTGESVRLEKNETIDSDFFAAGEKVVLAGTINNDAYVAGGNIDVEGNIKGDLLVAGGNVNIRGAVDGNVRVAGGNVNIEGSVGKNLTALGGSIDLSKSATVAGNLVSAGGNLQIRAPIKGKATLAGGNIDIGSEIGSDVNAATEKLNLTSNAKVLGNINYWSENRANFASDATVAGKLNFNKVVKPQVDRQRAEAAWAGLKTGLNIYKFSVGLILGLLLIWAFPNFMQRSADQILTNPLASFGWGFLFLVAAPVVIVLLFITILGIPLALIALFAYILIIMIAQVFSSLALGEWLLKRFNQRGGMMAAFIVGLVVLSLVKLIPVLGGIVSFVALLIGLGGYLTIKYSAFGDLRAKKVL